MWGTNLKILSILSITIQTNDVTRGTKDKDLHIQVVTGDLGVNGSILRSKKVFTTAKIQSLVSAFLA